MQVDSMDEYEIEKLATKMRERLTSLNKLNSDIQYLVYPLITNNVYDYGNFIIIEAYTDSREALRIAEVDIHHVMRGEE